jgi:hypothetical protein
MIVRLLLQKCAWVPLAVLLVGPGAVLAQPGTPAPPTATNAPGRVVGSVVQAGSGKPVEFATVVLLRADADRAVVGGACDAQGQFVLGGVPAGTYRLRVSYVGYETRLLDSVRVAGGAVALPAIALKASAQQLDEVQVTAERQLVETKVDRLVYNAEKDLTNAGGTAADVLQKTPLLSVDINGTPQLRGSANLLVLINGKPPRCWPTTWPTPCGKFPPTKSRAWRCTPRRPPSTTPKARPGSSTSYSRPSACRA